MFSGQPGKHDTMKELEMKNWGKRDERVDRDEREEKERGKGRVVEGRKIRKEENKS